MDQKEVTQKFEEIKKHPLFPKILSILSYFGVLALVPFILKTEDPDVRAHAQQGLGLFAAEIVFSLFWIVPFLGWLVGGLGLIACFLLSIVGMFNAFLGKHWTVPIIGEYAKKIKI